MDELLKERRTVRSLSPPDLTRHICEDMVFHDVLRMGRSVAVLWEWAVTWDKREKMWIND